LTPPPAFLAVVVKKTCWDIEADANLEFAVNVVAKVAVLVKELEKAS
jgi:hypothetical protein